MIWGETESHSRRIKIGLAFLLVGGLLIVWAWGSWAFRTSTVNKQPPTSVRSTGEGLSGDRANAETVKHLPRLLLLVLVLALVCLFGSYALIRIARRFRATTDRERSEPTESTSVWEEHKLP